MKVFITVAALPPLVVAARPAEGGNDALLPYKESMSFAQTITYRPANGTIAEINPPRFSWPYVPGLLVDPSSPPKLRKFVLELSRNSDFSSPEYRFVTETNFFNALPALEAGRWWWRVGFFEAQNAGEQPEEWNAARNFVVEPGVPTWDRAMLANAAVLAAEKAHPRFAPRNDDWAALCQATETEPLLADFLASIVETVDAARASDWWGDKFPVTDDPEASGFRKMTTKDFAHIARALYFSAFLYQLENATGEKPSTGSPAASDSQHFPQPGELEAIITMATRFASYPEGGLSSPENGGKVLRDGSTLRVDKRGGHVVYYVALIYDLLYDELTPEQRAIFRSCVRWRLRASWERLDVWERPGGELSDSGLGAYMNSHAIDAYVPSTAAALLAVESEDLAERNSIFTKVVDVGLNFLAGVGSTFGTEEGYNELGGYTFYKTRWLQLISMTVDAILPKAIMRGNPVWARLGGFYADQDAAFERTGFGEHSGPPIWTGLKEKRPLMSRRFLLGLRMNAMLTGRSQFDVILKNSDDSRKRVIDDIEPEEMITLYNHPLNPSAKADETRTRAYRDFGAVATGSKPALDPTSAQEGSRLLFIARPRGGYSHSYAADGSFAWVFDGESLAGGGGLTFFRDFYSRHTMSHNAILIDGRGQTLQTFPAALPYAARLVFFDEDPKQEIVAWAADLAPAYQARPAKNRATHGLSRFILDPELGFGGVENLERWIRYMVLLRGKFLFIFDDLAMTPGSNPVRFSWLYHIPSDGPLVFHEDQKSPGFEYGAGKVQVRALFGGLAAQEPLEMINLRALDASGVDEKGLNEPSTAPNHTFFNPVTKRDMLPDFIERRMPNPPLKGEDFLDTPKRNIWITTEPTVKTTFLTALTPTVTGAFPHVSFPSDLTAKIVLNGEPFRLSFDASQPGDYVVDTQRIRRHVEATTPHRLPSGENRPVESLKLGPASYPVRWLADENFARDDWPARWLVRSRHALVRPAADALLAATSEADARAVFWYRPSLPKNFALNLAFELGAPVQGQPADSPIADILLVDSRPLDREVIGFQAIQEAMETSKLKGICLRFSMDKLQLLSLPEKKLLAVTPCGITPGRRQEAKLVFKGGKISLDIDGDRQIDDFPIGTVVSNRLGLGTSGGVVKWGALRVGEAMSHH